MRDLSKIAPDIRQPEGQNIQTLQYRQETPFKFSIIRFGQRLNYFWPMFCLKYLPNQGAESNDPLHLTHHGGCCAERRLNAFDEQPAPFDILRLYLQPPIKYKEPPYHEK